MQPKGSLVQVLHRNVFISSGLIIAGLLLVVGALLSAPDPVWQNLSSRRGEIPAPPGGSTQQTGAVVGDFDADGVNEFILSFRQKPPALVWYRRTATGWDPWIIEKEYLPIEAGGAVHDIDRDGDPDVVFGGDWQSSEVWWWENPAPDFDKNVPWKRHVTKTGGMNQHHDQVFGDFLGSGKPQLAFWNQRAKTLFLGEIPADPRSAGLWPLTEVVSGAAAGSTPYTEGLSAFDVDGDGRGNFRKTEVVVGHGWHEARLADLDGDGDLDLLNKPYTWDTPRVDVWLNNGTRASHRGSGTSKTFYGPVGLQLYSLRDLLGKNVPLGLQTARSLGFREVELAGTCGDATLFDLLVQETKPELVSFEMDIFWTVHPGQDPVKLLQKYPNCHA